MLRTTYAKLTPCRRCRSAGSSAAPLRVVTSEPPECSRDWLLRGGTLWGGKPGRHDRLRQCYARGRQSATKDRLRRHATSSPPSWLRSRSPRFDANCIRLDDGPSPRRRRSSCATRDRATRQSPEWPDVYGFDAWWECLLRDERTARVAGDGRAGSAVGAPVVRGWGPKRTGRPRAPGADSKQSGAKRRYAPTMRQ